MTIVNRIEIDNIHYKQNDIKHAITPFYISNADFKC